MSQRCEICGTLEPRYVCRQCGRRVCGQDFRPEFWLCTSCAPISGIEAPIRAGGYSIGLSWISLASFAMVVIGMILMALASFTQGRGDTSLGGVILIGPIPIVLGGGPESTWLVLLGAVITVVALFSFLLLRKKMHA